MAKRYLPISICNFFFRFFRKNFHLQNLLNSFISILFLGSLEDIILQFSKQGCDIVHQISKAHDLSHANFSVHGKESSPAKNQDIRQNKIESVQQSKHRLQIRYFHVLSVQLAEYSPILLFRAPFQSIDLHAAYVFQTILSICILLILQCISFSHQ